MWQNYLLRELQRLCLVAVALQISTQRESIGKLNFREVLPMYINGIGRNLFSMVIEKVAVANLLLSTPEVGMFFVLFHCI